MSSGELSTVEIRRSSNWLLDAGVCLGKTAEMQRLWEFKL